MEKKLMVYTSARLCSLETSCFSLCRNGSAATSAFQGPLGCKGGDGGFLPADACTNGPGDVNGWYTKNCWAGPAVSEFDCNEGGEFFQSNDGCTVGNGVVP